MHPLVNEHDSALYAIAAVVVRRSRLFVLFHPTGYFKIKKQTPILLMGWNRCLLSWIFALGIGVRELLEDNIDEG